MSEINQGVVDMLVHLFEAHDIEEKVWVRASRIGPSDRRFHDFLEDVTLLAMRLATDAEVGEAMDRHEPVPWV